MAGTPDNYPKPQHLVGIYRPLADVGWVDDFRAAAVPFRGELFLDSTPDLRMHLFSQMELGRVAAGTLEAAEAIEARLREHLPRTFFNEITVAVNALVVMRQDPGIFLTTLKGDARLVHERRRASRNMPWNGQRPQADEFVFQMKQGKIRAGKRQNHVRNTMRKVMPTELTFGPGKIKVI